MVKKEDLVFTNKYGDEIKIGTKVFFPVVDREDGKIGINQAKVKAITFTEINGEIVPMLQTNSYLLNINDVRIDYKYVEGVIEKWKRKVLKVIERSLVS